MNSPAVDPAAKKLRVAVLTRTFSPTGGGAERYAIALVEQLAARHDIHVYAQVIEHRWPGVTYHRVPTPLRKPRWVNQLWFAAATWWATRNRFDVVHSHENSWHGQVQTVHVLPVKHNLFHGRTGLHRVLQWLKVVTSPRLLTYLGLEMLRYAPKPHRRIVVTSDSLRRIMVKSYPRCAHLMSVITPGIDLPALACDIAAKTEVRRRARERLQLPVSSCCLLFIANDFRKKGLNTLLSGLSQLPEDTVLAVVGEPNQARDFRSMLLDLKLAHRVFFLGRLNDVSDAYLAADCLVHPTLEDTFAMVVLEAMSFGLPCVVSGAEFCGIASLLEDRVHALVLRDPRDPSELVQLLTTLAKNPTLQVSLSVHARAFAEGYQWPALADHQHAIYKVAKVAA